MPKIASWLRVLAGVALLLATRWASAAGNSPEGAPAPQEAILVVPRAA